MNNEKDSTGAAWADAFGCLGIVLILVGAFVVLPMLLAAGWRP